MRLLYGVIVVMFINFDVIVCVFRLIVLILFSNIWMFFCWCRISWVVGVMLFLDKILVVI